MRKKFYVTVAIPYVNAPPHLGHALEFVQADCLARYHRLLGEDVFLTTGADENALKNVRAAKKEGITPLEICTQNLVKFQKLAKLLNTQFSVWRRGSDKKYHWPGVRKVWKLCQKNGDIYKKAYRGFYCVGCEAFLTKKDLIAGKCPYHLKKPEIVEEENYFFRLSRYQEAITNLLEEEKVKIIPQKRKNEVLSFLKGGLEDFSISRLKQRAKGWGIPVPGDPSQIIYVWYDALVIYLTAVGYGYDQNLFESWWPVDLHIIGKDIIRFHAVYWLGMLLSAKLPLPAKIFIHGFITSKGQKMSKTLGNVIDPFSLIEKFGPETVRYYLLREIPPSEDGDLTVKRFKEVYNADLANGLGNLVSRVAKLAEGYEFKFHNSTIKQGGNDKFKKYHQLMNDFKFNEVLLFILRRISETDKYIEKTTPWKLKGKELEKTLNYLIPQLVNISSLLEPFLPETAQKIKRQFQGKVKTAPPLFPRLS